MNKPSSPYHVLYIFQNIFFIFPNILCQFTYITIFFSTHITADLEKCADDITYIQKGEILATGPIGEFQQSYRLIRRQGGLTAEQQAAVLGRCREKAGDTLLIRRERTPLFEGLPVEEPTLEEIMVHLEKEGDA